MTTLPTLPPTAHVSAKPLAQFVECEKAEGGTTGAKEDFNERLGVPYRFRVRRSHIYVIFGIHRLP